MRERWYGDPRDLIKWATLVHAAGGAGIRTIAQIGFVAGTDGRPTISSGSDECSIQDAVWRHFRNLQDIKRLSSETGLLIEVFDRPFVHRSRRQYVSEALRCVSGIRGRKLVFLDPDTGLAIAARGPRHVSGPEVAQFWAALRPHDQLVLYQHAWRKSDWVNQARQRFGNAISFAADVRVYRSTRAGRDVVFLAARRKA